jgi:hypothetical protein
MDVLIAQVSNEIVASGKKGVPRGVEEGVIDGTEALYLRSKHRVLASTSSAFCRAYTTLGVQLIVEGEKHCFDV